MLAEDGDEGAAEAVKNLANGGCSSELVRGVVSSDGGLTSFDAVFKSSAKMVSWWWLVM